jgi:hypothetical protein
VKESNTRQFKGKQEINADQYRRMIVGLLEKIEEEEKKSVKAGAALLAISKRCFWYTSFTCHDHWAVDA